MISRARVRTAALRLTITAAAFFILPPWLAGAFGIGAHDIGIHYVILAELAALALAGIAVLLFVVALFLPRL